MERWPMETQFVEYAELHQNRNWKMRNVEFVEWRTPYRNWVMYQQLAGEGGDWCCCYSTLEEVEDKSSPAEAPA